MTDRNATNINNNDTTVWSLDNTDQERSSTPLYPSVAQRIVEWTTLSSEQSRLKSLSYNDNNGSTSSLVGHPDFSGSGQPPPPVPTSPVPPLFQHRRFSENVGRPSGGRHGSSSSLDRSSIFSSINENRIAVSGVGADDSSSTIYVDGSPVGYGNPKPGGHIGTILVTDHDDRYDPDPNNGRHPTRSSQTEVLSNFFERNPQSSPSIQNPAVAFGNNNNQLKVHFQMLIAELDASRDLNRKLSMQLAKTERDLQSVKIQQDLQNDKLDAVVASRVSEILNRLCENDLPVRQNSTLSSLAPSPPTVDNFDYVPDVEVKRLLMQLNKPNLNADEIAKNCNAMLSYVKSRGGDCRIGQQNDVWSEKMHNLTLEKNEMEKRMEFMTERMKNVEYENLALKTRLDESTSIVAQESKELRDIINELRHENEKLKISLADASKKSIKPIDLINLETEKQELKRQLDRELVEKQELFLQLNTVNSSRSSSIDDEIDRYRSEIDRYRHDVDRLSKELREARDQSLESGRHRDDNERRLVGQVTDALTKIDQLQRRLIESDQANDQLTDELAKCQDANDQLETDVSRLRANLITTENRLNDRRDDIEIDRLRAELARAVDHENRSADELTKVCDENETLIGRLEELSTSGDQLIAQLDELSKSRDRLIRENQELSTSLDRLARENEDLSTSRDRLSREQDESRDQLRADNERLSTTIESLKKELSVEKSRSHDQDNRSELIAELESAVDQRNQSISDFEKLHEKYELQQSKFERESYELRRRFQEADEQKFQLQEELKLQKREINSLKSDTERRLIEQREELKKSMTSATATPPVENRSILEMEEKLKIVFTEKKQLETKNDELKRLVTVLRRKLGALTT